MAKQKKRGFFSWLGFGQKEQAQESETEQKVEAQQEVAEPSAKTEEQQAVEEPSQPETPVETAAVVDAEETAHSKEEVETFAEEVVEVTEQVQESEKPEPVVVEAAIEAPQAAIEHEELPLPEEVKDEAVSAEEWQAEAETVEIVEAVEEEAALEPELTDEELEAQALAAEAAEEAVIVVPVEEQAEEETVQEQEKPTKEGFFARLKRSLLKTKENLGSGFISLFRGKKIDDDLFEELEEQLLIADVGVETTRKIIANLTEGASRKQLRDAEALYGLLKDEMGEILAKVDEPLNIEGKTPFVILMVGVNGVGKTTTTVNVGIGLAREGKKVLLIDADPQGSLTASLGYEEPDDLRITLATIMMDVINEEEISLEDGILHHQENVDLLPANIELSALEVTMGNVMSREMIMKEYIDAIRCRYDYILIDCMPSLGMMTINALVSSDSVLIPVQAAYLPVKGLQQLIKTILTVKKRLNRKLAIEGILLTMVDFRTNYARDIASRVHTTYGSQIEVFENVIPMSVKAAETSAEGKSIYMHCPKGKVAEAYMKLTQEVLNNEK